MKSTRVAHVVHGLSVGGLERVVVNLVANVDPGRFSSAIYALESAGPLMEEAEKICFSTEVMGRQPGLSWSLSARIARAIRRDKIDVLHCHNFGPVFYGSLAARLCGKPVVYTLHGPEVPAGRKQVLFQRRWPIDRMVAVSDYVRRAAISALGVGENRVVTIRNGIDLRPFDDASGRDGARAELGLDPDHLVVGNVSRMSAEKDHGTLLRAFARVVERRPDARLVLVGEGGERAAMEKLASELSLHERVSFWGQRTDVARVLQAFDVFALSSVREGLGITLLEAMACGVPVVATEVGGIPEVVADGAGVLVPAGNPGALADAIGALLSSPARRLELAERGRQRVRNEFAVAAMASRYERVYNDVTGRKAAA